LDGVKEQRRLAMEGHVLSCTFCKRSEKHVRKLVAGPGVYICHRCTERAHAIIHQGEPPGTQASAWRRRPVR
jgi:hypothetical protein